MTGVNELVEWLRAQLDEDERLARAAMRENPLGLVLCLHLPPEVQQHNARHDPARVLREVEAKRLIIIEHEYQVRNAEKGYAGSRPNNRVLRYLASIYADRPGYREEWRP